MKKEMAENAAAEIATEKGKTVSDAGDAAGEENSTVRTRAFSERLSRMTKKAVDDFIASIGLIDEDGELITSRERYDEVMPVMATRDEEERLALLSEISSLRDELHRLYLEKQDAEMLSDPERGDMYEAMRNDVLELVGYCRENGHSEVDVMSAFEALMMRNGAEVLKTVQKKARDDAMRRLNEQLRSGVGRLSANGENVKSDYRTMSDAEFAEQLEMAKRGALRAR